MKPLLIAMLSAATACTEHRGGITGTQSLKVEITSPTDLGSLATRLPLTMRNVTFNVTAYDVNGAVDTTFTNTVGVRVHYLGTLSPYFDNVPIKSIAMVAGKATNQTMTLPATVFGPTTLWIDDGGDSFGGDDVRSLRQARQVELLEVHAVSLRALRFR